MIWTGLRFAGQAADFEQFESERLDLGQHAVQRGLVGDASKQRVRATCLGVQGGERELHGAAQVAADPDLIARRKLPVAPLAGHWLPARSDATAVVVILARENRHRAARSAENASTAGKVPVNPDTTPTPTTGMIRPA